MKALDLKKLIKVLNMTSSSYDGEALNAIRLANNMLKSAEVAWSDLLNRTSKKESHSQYKGEEVHKSSVSAEEIASMFSILEKYEMSFSNEKFVRGLKSYFLKNNFLSVKQFGILEEIYDRVLRNGKLRV